eukprot:gene32907-40625_t
MGVVEWAKYNLAVNENDFYFMISDNVSTPDYMVPGAVPFLPYQVPIVRLVATTVLVVAAFLHLSTLSLFDDEAEESDSEEQEEDDTAELAKAVKASHESYRLEEAAVPRTGLTYYVDRMHELCMHLMVRDNGVARPFRVCQARMPRNIGSKKKSSKEATSQALPAEQVVEDPENNLSGTDLQSGGESLNDGQHSGDYEDRTPVKSGRSVAVKRKKFKRSRSPASQNFSDISPSKVTRTSSDSESHSDTEDEERSNSEDRDKSSLEGSLSESESESDRSSTIPSDTESDIDKFNPSRRIIDAEVDSNDSDDEKVKELKEQTRFERRKTQRAAQKAEKQRPPKQINLTTGVTPRPLTKLDHGSVRDWAAHLIMLRASGNHTNAYSLIDVKIREMIGIKMAAYEIPDNPKKKWITEKDLLAYRFWTDTRLTRRLLQLYPDERENAADRESVVSRVKRVRIHCTKANKWRAMDTYCADILTILSEFHDLEDRPDIQKELIKTILAAVKTCGTKGGVR